MNTCPERAFLMKLYFEIQKEYQKQPPKMGLLYLDRLRPTPGLIMPTVRSYSSRNQELDRKELSDILGKDYVGLGLQKKEYGILDKNEYGSSSLGYMGNRGGYGTSTNEGYLGIVKYNLLL